MQNMVYYINKLANTYDCITQLDSIVSYDNISHFNVIFAQYVGMSPGKYRKMSADKDSKA